jgi:Putative prokaryotic signal transducing protein
MASEDLVVVDTFTFRRQAEVAHSALRAFGIDCMLSADDLGGEGVGADLDEGVRLLVRAEDLERARDVLKTSKG